MNHSAQKGFTLVELLVTVAVFLILIGVGVPSFVSAMKNSRLNADYGELVGALYLARSEAVKRTGFVTVCARQSDTSCGANWENGWLVFTDNAGAGQQIGQVDGDDEILNISEGTDTRTVSSNASIAPDPSSASHATPQTLVRYNPQGSNNWSGGTFTLCDDRGEESARAVNVVLTGDIRKGRDDGSSTVPLNIYGNPVTCP